MLGTSASCQETLEMGGGERTAVHCHKIAEICRNGGSRGAAVI